jgi:hypothetical protein
MGSHWQSREAFAFMEKEYNENQMFPTPMALEIGVGVVAQLLGLDRRDAVHHHHGLIERESYHKGMAETSYQVELLLIACGSA